MDKKRYSLSALITVVILSVALAISVTMMIAMRHFNQQVNAVTQKQALYNHITDIDTKVRAYYASLDEEQLQAALAAGYVDGLNDPYAEYLSTAEYKVAQLERQGQASGVGITLVASEKGDIVVETVDVDSAAEKVGIKTGDILQSIDGETTVGAALQTLQNKLDSNAEKMILSVKRGEQTMAFEVTAYIYSLETVSDRMIGDTIGYIRITAFHDNTESQFTAAYSALQSEGATAFIFDLRGCDGGGSRDALEGILSYLMPHGAYATYTTPDGTVANLIAHSSHENSAPTVTLVNGETKGEAELMAGVLQEFSKTTVIGEKTVGKGKMQDFVPLKEDNSALLLTVGEISLIRGGSIEGVGITPNTVVPMTAYKAKRIGIIEDKEDDQLQAALPVLQGNVGGNLTAGTTVATVGTTAGTTAATTARSTASK